jgi:hypothetical protein
VSEIPGASSDKPVWTREVLGDRDNLMQNIDLALKIVSAVYTLFAAWQVAKMMCPQLKVHETMAIAAVKRKFEKKAPRTLPPLSNTDQAAIYDFTR